LDELDLDLAGVRTVRVAVRVAVFFVVLLIAAI
jgi:hypothetical protein